MSINLKEYQLPGSEPPHPPPKEGGGLWEFMNRDIKLFGKGLGAKKKEAYYTELEVLLKAGLGLKTALELLLESRPGKKEQATIQNIYQSIINGQSLSEAMAATGQFTEYEIFSIRIAEESGDLPPILAELATYFARAMHYRRLMAGALSYPALVITVAVLALAFLLNFLVPLFGGLYGRLNQELPPLTTFIVSLSNTAQAWFRPTLLALAGLLAMAYLQRKAPWLRKASSSMILKMPVFGSLIHHLYLARFCQAFAFLLSSRVPVLKAIELTQRMISFYPIEQALESSRESIFKGQPFHQSISRFRIFPPRLIALARVGEEANQLDTIFRKLAQQYNDEVEQRTKLLGSLIEPVLIVFLALVVGLILIAMYLPIFKLVTNFGI